MKHLIILILIIFTLISCQKNKTKNKDINPHKSQYYLKASVRNLPGKRIVLTTMFGHNQTFIDSTLADINGNFTFLFTKNSPQGMYRIMLGKDVKADFFGTQEVYFDLIFNHEDIEFSTDYYNPIDSMKISLSIENKEYYQFLKNELKSNMQLDILDQLTHFFPKGEHFYGAIKSENKLITNKQKQLYKRFFEKYPNSLCTKIIRARILPELPFELNQLEKSNYLKTHYLDKINFSDTILLYTNVFSTKAVDYIKLYHNTNLEKSSQNLEYFKAVDSLMIKSKINSKIFKYFRTYLLSGFEKIDNEEVLTYIINNYPEINACEDDKQTKNIKKRIEGSKKLAINSIAPSFQIKDINGSIVSLQSIKSDYVLIIFYASWCTHCKQILPEIKMLYEKQSQKKFETVAISIDTIKSDWENFVKSSKFNWINCCELKGWASKVAVDYFLYATPTMFLLNKKREIMAKPITFEELTISLNLIR